MNRNRHETRALSSGTPRATSRPGLTLVEFLVVFGIVIVLIALFLPAIRRDIGPTVRRVECKNNLKQIGLALHNYHDEYQAFPPANTVDAEGRPLHSWRTLILPFLGYPSLYESIDLTKPWDDPANVAVSETMPPVYRCPSADNPPNTTTYVGLVAPTSCLHPTDPRPLSEITDGTSNTLMVIEVSLDKAVPWMSPHDGGVEFVLSFGPETEFAHSGGTQAAFADGSVQLLSAEMPAAERRALTTIAGNEILTDETDAETAP